MMQRKKKSQAKKPMKHIIKDPRKKNQGGRLTDDKLNTTEVLG